MDNLFEDYGIKLEQDYVKATYDNIARDFSRTRHKKWPNVDLFLKNLQLHSLLLDVGCGNGKYLDNPTTFNIGCDLSLNLLKICKNRNFEVVLCDMTRLPFRYGVFDSLICIAALHHVTSSIRREKCLNDIINLMAPSSSSRLMVQVWAFEQHLDSENPYIKSKKIDDKIAEDIEIDKNIRLPIHHNRTAFQNQDILVPFYTNQTMTTESGRNVTTQRQLRYYHVFKQGELDSLLEKITNLTVLQSYHNRGNWCAIVSKREEIKSGEVD